MRQAADELRAELAGDTRDVRRQPQHQRLQRLHRRLRVLRLRPGQALARRLRALARGVRRAASHDARRRSARPRSACSRASTPTGALEDYLGWLRLAKETAPQLHLHAYSPMEIAHMCDVSGLPPARGLRAAARGRPRTRRPAPPPRCSHDGVRAAHQPEQAAGRALGRDHRGRATRAGLRSTVTVMFGHIEEPWRAGRAHARRARRCRSAPAASPSSCRCRFIPFQTLLGRTHGIEEISREENLKHTAVFRLALGPHDPEPAGELGEDGARRRHRGAALGRQRPRRDADGGVDLAHGRRLPRRQARPATT